MSDVVKARICGWGLLLGGLILLGLTGAMNWFQGDHLGVTQAGKFLTSVGSVAVDVVGLLFCGVAVGVCLAHKRWGWGFVFALAVLLSAGWSFNSMWSYQATERISASKTHEAEVSRSKDADKLEADSAKKAMDLAKSAGTRSARKDFITANQDAIKSFREAKITVLVAPDRGAQSMAEKLGWAVESVQFVQSGYFALLIIFLKMVGFPGAGFLLSWKPEPTDPDNRKLSGSPEGSGGKDKSQPATVAERGENVVDLPAKIATSPQLQAAPATVADSHKVSSEPPRVPAPAPKPTVPLTLKTTPSVSVHALLAANPGRTWDSITDLAKEARVSTATAWRAVARGKGQGKVEKSRKGRGFQVTSKPRRNGGLHALV